MLNRLLVPIITIALLTSCSIRQSDEEKNSLSNRDNKSSQTEIYEPIVVINNNVFTKEELDFYTLMNRLSVHLHRHTDEKALSGEKLKDKLAYWDEQLDQYDHLNVNLQSLIELNAMALLAEEKGYYISEKELIQQVTDFRGKAEAVATIQQLIDEYGKDKYNSHINEYIRLSMLKDHVFDDLRKDVKDTHPNLSERVKLHAP